MIIKGDKDKAFLYFDFFIRILAVMHWYWLFTFKYYYFDSSNSHRLPIFDFLDHESKILHIFIFIIYTAAVFLFALRKVNYVWSFLIVISFFYFEFHDKYSFHQDLFLAINIFFLFSFMKYYYLKNNIKAKKSFVFAMKILCSLVYFFAGFHKINDFFHSGILLEGILENGPLKFFVSEIPIWISRTISYVTLVIELSFPFLIWTKWKKPAVFLAVFLHVGIAIFGVRGLLFNMYLPCLWIFFFSFSQISVAEIRFKEFLRKTDIFNILTEDVVYKKTSFNEFKEMSNNVIWINPIFVMLFVAFLFNFLILSRKLIIDFI